MFVGYYEIHNDRVDQMWNKTTNLINVSRDVVWLKRMFIVKKEEEGKISSKPLAIEKVPITESREGDDDSKLNTSTDVFVNDESLSDDSYSDMFLML